MPYSFQVQTNAFTVIFDEHYSIPMDSSALEEYSLRFAAFGIDADERNISAGVADLKLSDLDLIIRPFNAWLYLQDVNKVGHGHVPQGAASSDTNKESPFINCPAAL